MIENKILKLLSNDAIDEAVELAYKLSLHSSEVRKLINQKARLKDLENLFQLGLISFSDRTIEKNKIRIALINLVQELEKRKSYDLKIKDEVEAFEKSGYSPIIQRHSGSGHNIGRDFIQGDKFE